jgi:hypothetical protein
MIDSRWNATASGAAGWNCELSVDEAQWEAERARVAGETRHFLRSCGAIGDIPNFAGNDVR